MRRRWAAGAAAVAGGAVLATGCAAHHGGQDGGQDAKATASLTAARAADAAASSGASAAQISIAPKDQAANVGLDRGVHVSVAGGRLTAVTMTETATGARVAGKLSADGHTWRPAVPLARSTAYSVAATAQDAVGRPSVAHTGFTTASPVGTFIGSVTPTSGSTVGVGMPVSVTFNKAITNQAGVQSHITVTSSSGQQVAGHWFGGQRLDFRPAQYWKPGSDVTVHLSLKHVRGAAGAQGEQNQTLRFHVGRSQVSTVDVADQTMTVRRDGAVVRTIPISSGSPQHPTYNGQMVISQKFLKTRMNGSTVGFGGEYDIPDVPHAMRLTSSGTFIHGNYWSQGQVFGHTPSSHGCIGIRDVRGAGDPTTNAAWFYDNSLVGDVVVVVHSNGRTVSPSNGLGDWNMPWSQWTAGRTAQG